MTSKDFLLSRILSSLRMIRKRKAGSGLGGFIFRVTESYAPVSGQ